jgi:hypothetical protein
MDNLNKKIFIELIKDWENPIKSDKLPTTYSDMWFFLDTYMERLWMKKGTLIKSIENQYK